MVEKKTIGDICCDTLWDKLPYAGLNADNYDDHEVAEAWETAASAVWDEAVEACIRQVKEYGDDQNSSLGEAETEGKEGPTLVFTGATMAAAAMIDRLRSLKRPDKTESDNA